MRPLHPVPLFQKSLQPPKPLLHRAAHAEHQLSSLQSLLQHAGSDVADLTLHTRELEAELEAARARVSRGCVCMGGGPAACMCGGGCCRRIGAWGC